MARCHSMAPWLHVAQWLPVALGLLGACAPAMERGKGLVTPNPDLPTVLDVTLTATPFACYLHDARREKVTRDASLFTMSFSAQVEGRKGQVTALFAVYPSLMDYRSQTNHVGMGYFEQPPTDGDHCKGVAVNTPLSDGRVLPRITKGVLRGLKQLLLAERSPNKATYYAPFATAVLRLLESIPLTAIGQQGNPQWASSEKTLEQLGYIRDTATLAFRLSASFVVLQRYFGKVDLDSPTSDPTGVLQWADSRYGSPLRHRLHHRHRGQCHVFTYFTKKLCNHATSMGLLSRKEHQAKCVDLFTDRLGKSPKGYAGYPPLASEFHAASAGYCRQQFPPPDETLGYVPLVENAVSDFSENVVSECTDSSLSQENPRVARALVVPLWFTTQGVTWSRYVIRYEGSFKNRISLGLFQDAPTRESSCRGSLPPGTLGRTVVTADATQLLNGQHGVAGARAPVQRLPAVLDELFVHMPPLWREARTPQEEKAYAWYMGQLGTDQWFKDFFDAIEAQAWTEAHNRWVHGYLNRRPKLGPKPGAQALVQLALETVVPTGRTAQSHFAYHATMGRTRCGIATRRITDRCESGYRNGWVGAREYERYCSPTAPIEGLSIAPIELSAVFGHLCRSFRRGKDPLVGLEQEEASLSTVDITPLLKSFEAWLRIGEDVRQNPDFQAQIQGAPVAIRPCLNGLIDTYGTCMTEAPNHVACVDRARTAFRTCVEE